MKHKLFPVYLDFDIFLLIVAHELELNLEGLWTTPLSCWSCKLIRLFSVSSISGGEYFSSGTGTRYFDLFEEVELKACIINSSKLNLRVIVSEGDFKALFHLPGGNRVRQLLQ